MQAAGRSHEMEEWRSSGKKRDRSLGTGNGGDLDRSKSPSLPVRNGRERPAPLEKFSGCLLESDAVGAGSVLFCFNPGVPSSKQQCSVLGF